MTTLMIDGSNVSTPQTDVRDLLPWNTKYYLQLENNRIEWFIFLTAHFNRVPKLHGNLQKKSAFGERVHEAKETILVNEFLVSKETVVLRRWERSKQKFGFIKRVDKG